MAGNLIQQTNYQPPGTSYRTKRFPNANNSMSRQQRTRVFGLRAGARRQFGWRDLRFGLKPCVSTVVFAR
jgi:hypothetical protein